MAHLSGLRLLARCSYNYWILATIFAWTGALGTLGCGDGEAPAVALDAAKDGTQGDDAAPFLADDVAAIGVGIARGYWPTQPPSSNGEQLMVAIDGGGGTAASQAAVRAIEEADIVKLDGDRLYAMSRYGGLAIVDISDRLRLTMLGQVRIDATPFELYLRGKTSLALYQGYGQWVKDDATQVWSWHTTSQVVAFDVSSPAEPKVIGRFTIAGDISDSRIVGDVLYVVASEANGCWGCAEGPRTTVIALSLADPAHVAKIDELAFEERTWTYSWKRSVTVTPERMYVAGPTWSDAGPTGSTIDVIDISDPSGKLVRGASVPVAGAIQSRWQMDEYEGVLRVISQPMPWSIVEAPKLQTFKVASSNSITALGSLEVKLPARESLRSARFDGHRGYAITAINTDPLFTFDLSNPAQPKQLGELVMPGWVYHIEPRGNLLLGLGYDQGNPDGSLAVSLFDVTQLDQPTMLSRVNFGGNWAALPEDQDRIHKAFGVYEEQGLILVPFDGYVYSYGCPGHARSGVQLIDWTESRLSNKSLAESDEQTRRGLLLDSDLLTVSDRTLRRYDIHDREHPTAIAELGVAPYVQRVAAAGNRVLRMTANDWRDSVNFDVVAAARANSPPTGAGLTLKLGHVDCERHRQFVDFAVGQNRAYIAYSETVRESGSERRQPRLMTLDISQEGAPTVLADIVVSGIAGGWNLVQSNDVLDVSHQLTLLGDQSLAVRVAASPGTSGFDFKAEELLILNLADPSEPTIHTMFRSERGPSQTQGTYIGQSGGTGSTLHGLQYSGSVFVFASVHPQKDHPGKVRYILHRLDLSDPDQPKQLNAYDIPGALLAYDDESARLITLDTQAIVDENITRNDCNDRYEYSSWVANDVSHWDVDAPGRCRTQQQRLTLSEIDGNSVSVLGSKELDVGLFVGRVANGDNRLFVSLAQNYRGTTLGCTSCSKAAPSAVRLIALRGLLGGEFAAGTLAVDALDYYGAPPIAAIGKTVVVTTGYASELVTIDASDVRKPEVVERVEVVGSVHDLVAVDTGAVAAMGFDGLASVVVR